MTPSTAGRTDGAVLLRGLRAVAVVCAGIAAGLALAHVLQRPGTSALDGPSWLAVQHTFYGGFAVVGGLGEVLGLLAAAGGAFLARRAGGRPHPLALAAACFGGMLGVYALGNRPVNAAVATWTPSTLPPDWTAWRDQWETAHALSAGLAVIALVVLAWLCGPRHDGAVPAPQNRPSRAPHSSREAP